MLKHTKATVICSSVSPMKATRPQQQPRVTAIRPNGHVEALSVKNGILTKPTSCSVVSQRLVATIPRPLTSPFSIVLAPSLKYNAATRLLEFPPGVEQPETRVCFRSKDTVSVVPISEVLTFEHIFRFLDRLRDGSSNGGNIAKIANITYQRFVAQFKECDACTEYVNVRGDPPHCSHPVIEVQRLSSIIKDVFRENAKKSDPNNASCRPSRFSIMCCFEETASHHSLLDFPLKSDDSAPQGLDISQDFLNEVDINLDCDPLPQHNEKSRINLLSRIRYRDALVECAPRVRNADASKLGQTDTKRPNFIVQDLMFSTPSILSQLRGLRASGVAKNVYLRNPSFFKNIYYTQERNRLLSLLKQRQRQLSERCNGLERRVAELSGRYYLSHTRNEIASMVGECQERVNVPCLSSRKKCGRTPANGVKTPFSVNLSDVATAFKPRETVDLHETSSDIRYLLERVAKEVDSEATESDSDGDSFDEEAQPTISSVFEPASKTSSLLCEPAVQYAQDRAEIVHAVAFLQNRVGHTEMLIRQIQKIAERQERQPNVFHYTGSDEETCARVRPLCDQFEKRTLVSVHSTASKAGSCVSLRDPSRCNTCFAIGDCDPCPSCAAYYHSFRPLDTAKGAATAATVAPSIDADCSSALGSANNGWHALFSHETVNIKQRAAEIDPCYHPQLSLREDMPVSLYYDRELKKMAEQNNFPPSLNALPGLAEMREMSGEGHDLEADGGAVNRSKKRLRPPVKMREMLFNRSKGSRKRDRSLTEEELMGSVKSKKQRKRHLSQNNSISQASQPDTPTGPGSESGLPLMFSEDQSSSSQPHRQKRARTRKIRLPSGSTSSSESDTDTPSLGGSMSGSAAKRRRSSVMGRDDLSGNDLNNDDLMLMDEEEEYVPIPSRHHRPERRRGSAAQFDINHVVASSVLPNMVPEKIPIRTIQIPEWREVSLTPDPTEGVEEDTSDEAYARRHIASTVEEMNRFSAPVVPLLRQTRKRIESRTNSGAATPDQMDHPSDVNTDSPVVVNGNGNVASSCGGGGAEGGVLEKNGDVKGSAVITTDANSVSFLEDSSSQSSVAQDAEVGPPPILTPFAPRQFPLQGDDVEALNRAVLSVRKVMKKKVNAGEAPVNIKKGNGEVVVKLSKKSITEEDAIIDVVGCNGTVNGTCTEQASVK